MSSNKPASDGAAAEARWAGTADWYLWEGGFAALGRSEGIVPPHEHHAIQIVLSVEGRVGIVGKSGDWRMTLGFIVRPDVVHSYNGNGAVGAMVFVDPESSEGVWLKTSLREDITIVPKARIARCAAELRTFLDSPLES